VLCGHFREVPQIAKQNDLIYLDPPYQGISEGRDRRYIEGVRRGEIVELLEQLNSRAVEFILSYDGNCGGKAYGDPLPAHLHVHRVLVEVGRSSQATLNGHNHVTVESVYLSRGLYSGDVPTEIPLKAFTAQIALFS